MVQYFIENAEKLSVDVNDQDINGENALFYATRANKLQVINYLLDHGEAFEHVGVSTCKSSAINANSVFKADNLPPISSS